MSKSTWRSFHDVDQFTALTHIMMNGLAHHYRLGESIVIFKGIRSVFEYFFLIFL